ncbi:MAG: hypothetical protein OEM59_11125 [Rhodospirillales bacterium]|nr:hypothetical protein [Rhodospirillales bacterium]
MKRFVAILLPLLVFVPALPAAAYPLYGSEESGIRRLEEARLAQDGVIEGRKKISGELLSLEQVDLRLIGRKDLELPPADPAFTREIVGLLGAEANRYGIAVLDLSDPANPRYAEHNGFVAQNPGSVGKIMVGTGLFQALAEAYPTDLEKRRAVLRETVVTADDFIVSDSHTVRLWDPATRVLTRRPLQLGDRGSLYEWLDWMLSASSNAAAATVQKQAMLLKQFGTAYPVSDEAGIAFFKETKKDALRDLHVAALIDPLTRNGIDTTRLRQGSLFTHTGKAKVPGTSSYATSRELLVWLLRLEQGRIVDEFSSREIKRLLYMTERRIRYASSPALHEAAVYFKSGSLYSCQPEEGFTCKKYHGNKVNYMNSVAIVESPAGSPRLYYMVALLSNVLRKNSAVDHQTLATRIHRLLEKHHGE